MYQLTTKNLFAQRRDDIKVICQKYADYLLLEENLQNKSYKDKTYRRRIFGRELCTLTCKCLKLFLEVQSQKLNCLIEKSFYIAVYASKAYDNKSKEENILKEKSYEVVLTDGVRIGFIENAHRGVESHTDHIEINYKEFCPQYAGRYWVTLKNSPKRNVVNKTLDAFRKQILNEENLLKILKCIKSSNFKIMDDRIMRVGNWPTFVENEEQQEQPEQEAEREEEISVQEILPSLLSTEEDLSLPAETNTGAHIPNFSNSCQLSRPTSKPKPSCQWSTLSMSPTQNWLSTQQWSMLSTQQWPMPSAQQWSMPSTQQWSTSSTQQWPVPSKQQWPTMPPMSAYQWHDNDQKSSSYIKLQEYSPWAKARIQNQFERFLFTRRRQR